MSRQARKGGGQSGTRDSRLSEIHLAIVYGIEGLARYGEEDTDDEWLKLFETALDELEKPARPEFGGFKLSSSGTENLSTKEMVIPDEDKREEVVDTLGELADFAERLEACEMEEDGETSPEAIKEKIEAAKEVRDTLEQLKSE